MIEQIITIQTYVVNVIESKCKFNDKKNYVFIGANKTCCFFVHKNEIEKLNINLPSLNSLDIYTQSNIRESRSESGDLTFLSGEQKLRAISDCKVINLDSKSQNQS